MNTEPLIIDPELERLIPRISEDEKELLEKSILEEGCREPLYIWNNTILDGHNRYQICTQHHVPYRVVSVPVSSRDEAIVWICINQMGRRNISDETRHYLIGKRYEAEKRIGTKNPIGRNQYSLKEDAPPIGEQPKVSARDHYTSVRIGQEYGLGHHSIEQYGRYARDIDRINDVAPELSSKILSGDLYVSMGNVTEIAHLTEKQIQAVSDNIVPERHGHIQHEEIMKCLGKIEARQQRAQRQANIRDIPVIVGQTVKDIPEYNPDSAISSLTLTMPTWISSMNRTFETANLALVTETARSALKQELIQLRSVIDGILSFI